MVCPPISWRVGHHTGCADSDGRSGFWKLSVVRCDEPARRRYFTRRVCRLVDRGGHDIQRIDGHDERLARFETALRALPDKQRQQSVLLLLDAYRKAETPLRGAPPSTDVFRDAVRA